MNTDAKEVALRGVKHAGEHLSMPDSAFDAIVERDAFGYLYSSGIAIDFRTGSVEFWQCHRDNLNTVSFDQYHGHIASWAFECPLPGDQMIEVAQELRADFELLASAYRSKWDGNNVVAVFDVDCVEDVRDRMSRTVTLGSDEEISGEYVDAQVAIRDADLTELVTGLLPDDMTLTADGPYGTCPLFASLTLSVAYRTPCGWMRWGGIKTGKMRWSYSRTASSRCVVRRHGTVATAFAQYGRDIRRGTRSRCPVSRIDYRPLDAAT